MAKEFEQTEWDEGLQAAWRSLLDLAVAEDLGSRGDLTSLALVPADAQGRAEIVVRRPGVLAGGAAIPATIARFDPRLRWLPSATDGAALAARQSIGRLEGPARAMLTVERPLLNLIGRLSGIASLTRRYVEAVAGTRARIYDTRKTTPGWRRLEKFAVRCGGGMNHRRGLFEAVLIKDNHLAFGRQHDQKACGESATSACRFTPAEAVVHARRYLETHFGSAAREMIVEVEVDTLEQFDEVLAVSPDLILLDNMGPDTLREAVRRRDVRAAGVELEASGGVDLSTVAAIAAAGVDRISVGALTHSAAGLDFGLDWLLADNG